jgi:TetR/AcrR family fatty acid metabolism transcriptional regulator
MGRINRSEEKREEILGHVYEIIRSDGVEGATFSRIAEHAGIHKSLLTYYFDTKEAMIISLVDKITERYIETFHDAVSRIQDPHERLMTSLDMIFDRQWVRVIDYRVFYSCFYLGLMNEEIRRRFAAMYDRLKEILVRELSTYAAHGIVKIDDPEKTAILIIIGLEGFDYYLAVSGYDARTEAYGRHVREHLVKMLDIQPRSGAR